MSSANDGDKSAKDLPKKETGNNTGFERPSERPSERMFRRSRAAEMRRRQAAKKDDRFMRFVFGIAGFTLLLTFLFFFMYADFANAVPT